MSEWVTYTCVMLVAACVVIQDRRIVALEEDMERLRTIYKAEMAKREEEEVPS